MSEVLDILSGKKLKYDYDILDRLASESIIDTTKKTTLAELLIQYDDTKNRISGYDVEIGNTHKSNDYIYGELTKAPDVITGIKQDETRILSYGYDSLNRLLTRTIATTTPFVTEYGYLEGATANTTTTLVKTVKNGNDTLEYTYDVLGNITSVSKNGSIIESYTYDNLNQLKTVTRGTDTYEYTYDNGGNILSVKRNGEIIKTYTYGDSEWKDLLTAYNGENITYDTIGNPLTYRAGMNFTWTDGRKLSNITKETDSISYTYDANGLRSSKTVNETTTEYYWLDGTLHGQKTGNEYLLFLYDENGRAYGFILQNGTEKSYYYYEFNLQGDIIGIIDSNGTKVVEYTYGAWGDILSATGTLADSIGQKNPLRYRGYYYDAETGFYYVSSRYYDPEIGRWLNADGEISGVGGNITEYNLYTYCGNNPINRIDPNGRSWKDVKNWFSNTWNTAKSTVKKVVREVKEKTYSVYYNATKWHFEDREKKNGTHPSYSDVTEKNSGWNLLPESQSIYHDNGVGKSELKYITSDGKEAVFDGDTLQPVTDPKYIATYNYSPLYQIPASGTGFSDYVKLAGSGIGHFFADMLPYYLTGNSNTREQFESKIFIFN